MYGGSDAADLGSKSSQVLSFVVGDTFGDDLETGIVTGFLRFSQATIATIEAGAGITTCFGQVLKYNIVQITSFDEVENLRVQVGKLSHLLSGGERRFKISSD